MKILEGIRPTQPSMAAGLGLSDELWFWMVQAWLQDPFQRPSLGNLASVISDVDHYYTNWNEGGVHRECRQTSHCVQEILIMSFPGAYLQCWMAEHSPCYLSPDARHIVRGYSNGSFLITDITVEGLRHRHYQGPLGPCKNIRFSTDSCHFLVFSHGQNARVWSIDTALPVGPLLELKGSVQAIVLSLHSKVQILSYSSYDDYPASCLHLLDATTGENMGSAEGPHFHPHGQYTIIHSADHTLAAIITLDEIMVYQVFPLTYLGCLSCDVLGLPKLTAGVGKSYYYETRATAFIGSGILTTVCVDSSRHPGQWICLWEPLSPGCFFHLTALSNECPLARISNGTVSPDGTQLAISDYYGVHIYDVNSGDSLDYVAWPYSDAHCFSLAGEHSQYIIVHSSGAATTRLWNINSGCSVFELDLFDAVVGPVNHELLQDCYGSGGKI